MRSKVRKVVMEVRKPVEGLLEPKRRQRWWWFLVPGVVVAAFTAHLIVTSHALMANTEPPARAENVDSAHVGAAAAAEEPPAEDAEQAQERAGSAEAPASEPSPAPEPPAEVPAAQAEPEPSDAPTDEQAAVAEAPVEPVEAAEDGESGHLTGKLKQGETLFTALTNRRFSAGQVQGAINAMSKVFDFRKSRPGDDWEVSFDAEHRVLELIYRPDPEAYFVAKWDAASQGYKATEQKAAIEVKIVGLGGTVRSTLYKALLDLGEKNRLISGFIDRFAYDIDFGSETKPGDTFRILFEKVYLDGKFLRYGYILAAEYSRQGKPLRIYQFNDGGELSYHDKNGQSVKRMFLKNPVKFSRISSGFGKRFHPILKTWKEHQGVDYAAPMGTPVSAIAAGTITFVGQKGANGNLVAVQHANGMTSYYAHLSKFAEIAKRGQKVAQGDVIGFVGSTGRSTGPHLHLGVRTGQGFIDPLSVRSTRSVALSGPKLRQFKEQIQDFDRRISQITIQPPSDGPDEPPPTAGGDPAGFDEEDMDLP